MEALLERHGRTFAQELRIDVAKGTPSPLFRLLVMSILLSARIGHNLATDAARALSEQGWTTARKLGEATWEQRVRVLNHAGYARYDESTSRMLGDTCVLLLDRYGGDLRRLRDETERDPKRERALLKELKGLGDVGVDVFFREAQVAWEELRPFADRRSHEAAQRLGSAATRARSCGWSTAIPTSSRGWWLRSRASGSSATTTTCASRPRPSRADRLSTRHLVEHQATFAVLMSAVVGVAVAPGDVVADQARLGGVVGVVCAGEREVAQRPELRLDAVQPVVKHEMQPDRLRIRKPDKRCRALH